MVKIETYDEIYISDTLKNYLQAENISICQFLYFADFSDISRHIENKYYSGKNEHLRYPIESMLKLCIVKQFRALPYSKAVDSLTQEEAWLLGLERDDRNPEIYKIPSGSTLHHFVKYRLGIGGIDEIMVLVGRELIKNTTLKVAKTDSTPLEASRYNKYADYNPHYGCKMDKAHITMIGTWPVFMTHTSGNAGDSPELIAHIKALKELKANIDEYLLDGAYDSYENHADVWHHLDGATPRIYCGEDAVFNPEGAIDRINHWANKMWKLGGSIRMPIKEKLKFLYEQGRKEQVGAYFRNQNLGDVTFDDSYKLRKECERIHAHIKDTVKFDVRRIPNASKELYTKLSFVVYQMMLMVNVKENIKPENSFGKYF